MASKSILRRLTVHKTASAVNTNASQQVRLLTTCISSHLHQYPSHPHTTLSSLSSPSQHNSIYSSHSNSSTKQQHVSHSVFYRGMPTENVPVPTLGESISEGTIVTWNKKEGDYVKQDEVVVVIETDKVSVDIRSPKAGM